MAELRREVVRSIGSGRCHVADVADSDLQMASLYGAEPAQFVSLDPVVCVCTTQLRRSRGPVVVMTKAKVVCRTCARLTGIEKVAADA